MTRAVKSARTAKAPRRTASIPVAAPAAPSPKAPAAAQNPPQIKMVALLRTVTGENRTENERIPNIASPFTSGTSLTIAITAPKSEKNTTGGQTIGPDAANPYACNTVEACVIKPQLTNAPRTPMMQIAAKTGKRFSRNGGTEYAVPSRADPTRVTRRAKEQ